MRTFDFTVQASKKWPAALVTFLYLGIVTAFVVSQWHLVQPLVLNEHRIVGAGAIALTAAPLLLLLGLLDSHRTVLIGRGDLVLFSGRHEIDRIALHEIGRVRVTKLARCLEISDRAGNLRIRLNCAGLSNPSDQVLDTLLRTMPGHETRTEGRVQELRWMDRSAEFRAVH
ncbi:hypothetical protein EII34_09700 [Arachnia propionica]|uniref:Uncharacterized protein n=1 Tax=Arachnia propionica TaxID=1750 RepID=A0A3P1T5D6_9ACTN|nr:hypothetical protein [Arachnia propionica]MDO5082871.1 hypothetical protein [Arachnia propionica]RRD04570.1 hypothetical protein EII34_09700 [Arachnia propionica]